MIRVLVEILGAGGLIGAGSGWLLVRWLDARFPRRMPVASGRQGYGVRMHDSPAVVHLPSAPRPAVIPPQRHLVTDRAAGECMHALGWHYCHLPAEHEGEHECVCGNPKPPHRFA